jgi:ATP-independent RNA helicase DbpA
MDWNICLNHSKKEINMSQNNISSALANVGIKTLNSLQNRAVAAANNNNNVIVISPTGTGKTQCFLIPAIESCKTGNNAIQVLILSPTRELALQIEDILKRMKTGYKVNTFYGGHPIKTEINNLSVAPNILIGTPGRIADHLRRGTINIRNIKTLIIDEFDKTLELGFKKETELIINSASGRKKTILTSATTLKDTPDFIDIDKFITVKHDKPEDSDTESKVNFYKVYSEENDKLEALINLLCKLQTESSIIFCNHKDAVSRISSLLNKNGIVHDQYHGSLKQEERERAIIKIKNRSSNILLATDLAARGIDIDNLDNIIHYQLPKTEESYIHRNGRTARFKNRGNVYMVLSSQEFIPPFITDNFETSDIKKHTELPPKPELTTLYISLGRKEKISKKDVLGFLIHTGKANMADIDKIDISDHCSYVAVNTKSCKTIVRNCKGKKIKKQNAKIEISK